MLGQIHGVIQPKTCLFGQNTVLDTGATEVNDPHTCVNERGLMPGPRGKKVNMSRFHGQGDSFMETLSLKTWLKIQEDIPNESIRLVTIQLFHLLCEILS